MWLLAPESPIQISELSLFCSRFPKIPHFAQAVARGIPRGPAAVGRGESPQNGVCDALGNLDARGAQNDLRTWVAKLEGPAVGPSRCLDPHGTRFYAGRIDVVVEPSLVAGRSWRLP